MKEESLSPQEKEQQFFKMIVAEYLKYGSVDQVFKSHQYNLPISYMGFHRVLDKWGIVKAAGPNSKLSEAICFLTTLSQERIPLEKLYKSMPPSFQTSMSTLHRILHCIKEDFTRRSGTALVISPLSDPGKVLIGRDISTPRLEVGKPFGSLSLPMGYSRSGEPDGQSVLRVLQQEVFTIQAIEKQIPDIIPENVKPFMYLSMMDVQVAVYHLILPEEYQKDSFSSFKLENLEYVEVSQLVQPQVISLRSGIKEILSGYNHYLDLAEGSLPLYRTSVLNQELSHLVPEYLED